MHTLEATDAKDLDDREDSASGRVPLSPAAAADGPALPASRRTSRALTAATRARPLASSRTARGSVRDPAAELVAHFTQAARTEEHKAGLYEEPLRLHGFEAIEVATRLAECVNTAPGDDRLTYSHWRTVDPNGRLLSSVYNVCLKYRKIPHACKSSKTVLIHKRATLIASLLAAYSAVQFNL